MTATRQRTALIRSLLKETSVRIIRDGGVIKHCYETARSIARYERIENPTQFSANIIAEAIDSVRIQDNSATISPAEQRHRCQAGVQPHSGQGCPITPPRVGESTPGNETPSRGSVVTAPGPRRSTTTERLEPAQSRDLEGQ